MGSKFITVIALFLCASSVFAQERIWIKQTKISEVIAFEKEINPKAMFLAENISLSKEYYPLTDKYRVTNPVIVQRESFKYLPISAEYFYTPEDSVLRLVSYDWEKDRYGNFFDKQKMWKEESKRLDTYNSEYERIKTALSTQLGIPTSADTAAKEMNFEGDKYLNRETHWETNTFYAELSMIFASTTHRIRLTLYWKN